MTEDKLARPLTTEEEAEVRQWLADPMIPQSFGRGLAALDILPRLLATLDALRAAPVADTAGIDAEALAEAMWFEGLIDDHGPEGAAAKEAAESLAGAYRGMLKHRAAALRTPKPEGER